MTSLLHMVGTAPKRFLVRVLVGMLLEHPKHIQETDMWHTNAAIALGVNCLRNESDKTHYDWPEGEDAATTVIRVHLNKLLPFVEDVVNSTHYDEKTGTLCNV